MLLVDAGMGLVQHSPLLYWELPPSVLSFFENFAVLLIAVDIKVFSCLCCCVCGSGPTLGANIVSLARLLAATASTNTRNTALRIVHPRFIVYFH